MSGGLTLGLIGSYRENEINKDAIIELEIIVSEYESEVFALNKKVSQLEGIIDDKNKIIGNVDEVVVRSNKEMRRKKRQEAAAWFLDKWEEITIATGAFAVGVGVGYGMSK